MNAHFLSLTLQKFWKKKFFSFPKTGLINMENIDHRLANECFIKILWYFSFQELEYCKSVVLSVEDEMGVRTIMEDLLSVVTHNTDAPVCTAGVLILHTFCANTTEDVSDYLPQLFRGLIGLFARTDERLILSAWNCLDAIAKVNMNSLYGHC